MSSRSPTVVSVLDLSVLALVPLIWLQYVSGLFAFSGEAWTGTAFLLGFIFASLVGAYQEKVSPGSVGNFVFLAIGIAALGSLGLALCQWLDVEVNQLFIGLSDPRRPNANLGQPNQLATLLLLGMVSLLWEYERRRIGGPLAVVAAALILVGVALTASRAAWVGIFLMACLAWRYREQWRHRAVPWVLSAALPLLYLLSPFLNYLAEVLLLNNSAMQRSLVDASSNHRIMAWKVLAAAVWDRPWFGYGWNRTAEAQFALAGRFPPLESVFTFAHNLFLDLVLWFGLPVGIVSAAVLLHWMISHLMRLRNAAAVVMMMSIVVVASHAMLEMPLYYGYFLFPVGLVAGALNCRCGVPSLVLASPWPLRILGLIVALLFSIIVVDYFKVEDRMARFRLEMQNIAVTDHSYPELLILHQWNDVAKFQEMSEEQLAGQSDQAYWRDIAYYWHSPAFLLKLSKAQVLRGELGAAEQTLRVLGKIVNRDICREARKHWRKSQQRDSRLLVQDWPVDCESEAYR